MRSSRRTLATRLEIKTHLTEALDESLRGFSPGVSRTEPFADYSCLVAQRSAILCHWPYYRLVIEVLFGDAVTHNKIGR